jgi:hypothetical protein
MTERLCQWEKEASSMYFRRLIYNTRQSRLT